MRFQISEGGILCVDWDERWLRVLEASASRGGVKVRGAVRVPMTAAPGDAAALGELIKSTLSEHRLRARRAIMNVPRQDALLNLLSLPPGSQDELAAMVHIQIAKELPFSKDQTVIDFAVSPRKQGMDTLDVWVAAVRNNVIDFYRQVATAAGLRLERIGLRPNANLAAVNAGVEQTGRTLVVDIGPVMTEIDLLRDGQLAYSRSATVGIPESEPEKPVSAALDGLLVEVNRTLAAYRSMDSGGDLDRIVLAGTVSIDDAVVRAFQDRFGAPAEMFEVPPTVKWRAGAEATPAVFASVMGLALSHAGENLHYFNLLTPKEPESERRERIRQVPYRAALIVGLLTVAAAGAYYPLHQRHSQLTELEDQIEQLNKDKDARDELTGLVGNVQTWQGEHAYWIDHLRRIAEVFPSTREVYITKVEFKESGEIRLEVLARDEFQAEDIVWSLNELRENGKQLYKARLGTTSDSQDREYPVTDHVFIQINAMTSGEARR